MATEKFQQVNTAYRILTDEEDAEDDEEYFYDDGDMDDFAEFMFASMFGGGVALDLCKGEAATALNAALVMVLGCLLALTTTTTTNPSSTAVDRRGESADVGRDRFRKSPVLANPTTQRKMKGCGKRKNDGKRSGKRKSAKEKNAKKRGKRKKWPNAKKTKFESGKRGRSKSESASHSRSKGMTRGENAKRLRGSKWMKLLLVYLNRAPIGMQSY